MKLFSTTNSPFVRKVLIVAREHGLDSRIELVSANPWMPDNPVAAVSPTGKIPALVLDEGIVLYDSHVICEYLDSVGSGQRLFPAVGPERWATLRRSALADAMMEAMISRRLESRRPDGERSQSWMERQHGLVQRCLDGMEAEVDGLRADLDIGHIGWVCALAHLDFRFGDEPWRDGRPKLAFWFEALQSRESIRGTFPHD